MYRGTDSQPLLRCVLRGKLNSTGQTTLLSIQPPGALLLTWSCICLCSVALWESPSPSPGDAWGAGGAEHRLRLQPTCHEKLSSTSRLSRSIGGSQGVSSTVGFSHGGDRQSSAAIAKGDLHAGQSGSGNCLAIPKPAHLRNWQTWRTKRVHLYV